MHVGESRFTSHYMMIMHRLTHMLRIIVDKLLTYP